jgi:RNA polymerase sigma-70 factor (ECF subfamily)
VAVVDDDADAQAELLVEAFQAGCDSAFDELYRRSWPRVFHACLRSTGDHHEAEELAQETFARAWRALPSLSGERRWGAWLHVIAARLCVDAHRRRVVTDPLDDHEATLVSDDVALAHGERWDGARASPLGVAFELLPADQRDALRLYDLEGWTRRRVAAHLGATPGRVESLVLQARRSLRRAIED